LTYILAGDKGGSLSGFVADWGRLGRLGWPGAGFGGGSKGGGWEAGCPRQLELSIAIVLSAPPQNFFLWFAIILVNGPPLWHFRAQYFIDSFFFGHPPNLSTVVTARSTEYIRTVSSFEGPFCLLR